MKILSEQLREFLVFLQFYIVAYKENSTEVDWAVVGREKSLVSANADVPVEQRPSWQAYTRQEPIYICDWNTDEGIPIRLKQGIAAQGLDVGPLVFVPLTTPQRCLGALGMSGHPGIRMSTPLRLSIEWLADVAIPTRILATFYKTVESIGNVEHCSGSGSRR